MSSGREHCHDAMRVVSITVREADEEPSFPQNPVDPSPSWHHQESAKWPGWCNTSTGLISKGAEAQAGQLQAKSSLMETFWQLQIDCFHTFLTPGKQGQFTSRFLVHIFKRNREVLQNKHPHQPQHLGWVYPPALDICHQISYRTPQTKVSWWRPVKQNTNLSTYRLYSHQSPRSSSSAWPYS